MSFEFENKEVIKYHAAHDINGNKIAKLFYADGTTEIVRGSRSCTLPIVSDKFYKSLSGLYRSK
jgi:hypothetical protein